MVAVNSSALAFELTDLGANIEPSAINNAVVAMADNLCRPTAPLKNWTPTNSIDTSQSIAF